MSSPTLSIKCESCLAPLPLSKQPAAIIRCDYCGVDNVLSTRARNEARKQGRAFLVKLRQELTAQFSIDDLKLLIFDLNKATGGRIDIEDLAGGSKKMKILELLKWCERRQYVPQLVETAVSMRPAMAALLL